MNVFSNFVPNKITKCRDKDPPWITEEMKKICHNKAKIYEKYVKNDRSDADKDEYIRVISLTSDVIIKAKEKYFHSLGNKSIDRCEILLVYASQISSKEEKTSHSTSFNHMGLLLQMYVRK